MGLAKQAMLGVAGVFAALALTPQTAEAGTVVASSGPSAQQYPVGTQIGDTQRVTLREGDTLTVLTNGRTRVLRGPGTFILARRGAATSTGTLATLTTRRTGTQARVASSRGDGEEVSNPNLWYVDVAQSGTICLANPDPIQLWRSNVDEVASYSFSRAGAPAEAVNVGFPERQMLGIWESAVQLREGQTYTISGNGVSTELRFVFLQEIPTDGEELALTLIENGCNVQLDHMTRALAE